MRKLFFLVFALFVTLNASAQLIKPPKWTVSYTPKDVKVGDEVTISFTAEIPKDWYIYSSDFEQGGPTVTAIVKDGLVLNGMTLVGDLASANSKKKYDDIFEMEVGSIYWKRGV